MTTLPHGPAGRSGTVPAFGADVAGAPALHLRDAREADLPALLAIDRVFPSDRITAVRYRTLLDSRRATVRVAELDGRVVGYHVVLRRWFHRAGWLYSMAVAYGARRRGVGRRLLADAELAARRAGRTGLSLEVRQDNAPAIALYERAGYRRVKALPAYYSDGSDAWRYRRDWPRP